jgi:hypothetical protein
MRIEGHKSTGSDSQKDGRPVRGRKRPQESRATEFRQKLSAWRQLPISSRLSLRALARELGTSHQLLKYYLNGLEKWQGEKWLHEACEIRTRAYAEGRFLTLGEEQRDHDLTGAGVHAIAASAMRGLLERLKRDAKCGQLNGHQMKTLKVLIRAGFQGAPELLKKSLYNRVEWIFEGLICQRFPVALLSPLEPNRGERSKTGNSAKAGGEPMPSYESSMRNLAKANARWRPPRPWRSSQESQMIRRYVFQWLTCRDCRSPSGRSWARQLGVSHTWLQKLVRQFRTDPSEMYREARRCGEPAYAQLTRAREYTRRMREQGELRGSRLAKVADFFRHYAY